MWHAYSTQHQPFHPYLQGCYVALAYFKVSCAPLEGDCQSVCKLQAEGFLEKGVTPGIKDKEGRTGAHFSASRGELEMLQFLHSKGVDIDAEDKTGRSPLHFAALRDHESAVVFLASKAAWVDSCDATDCSPLHLAARGGSAATAARLLKLGARSHIKNQWNLTALGMITYSLFSDCHLCFAALHSVLAGSGTPVLPAVLRHSNE